MAQIKCPGCGNAVSDTVRFCSNCGYNVQAYIQMNPSAFESKMSDEDITGMVHHESDYAPTSEIGNRPKSVENPDLSYHDEDHSSILTVKNNMTVIKRVLSVFAVIIILCLAVSFIVAVWPSGRNDSEGTSAYGTGTEPESEQANSTRDSNDKDSITDASETNETTEVSNVEYTQVTVEEMYTDLSSNAYNAARKYKDQYVEVTGYVTSIDSAGTYIMLSDEAGDHILCDIDDSDLGDKLATMAKGDMAAIDGIVTDVSEDDGYLLSVTDIVDSADPEYFGWVDKQITDLVSYSVPKDWEQYEKFDDSTEGITEVRYVFKTVYTNETEQSDENADASTDVTENSVSYAVGCGIYLCSITNEDSLEAMKTEKGAYEELVYVALIGLGVDREKLHDDDTFSKIAQSDEIEICSINGIKGIKLDVKGLNTQNDNVSDFAFAAYANGTHVMLALSETDNEDTNNTEQIAKVLNSITLPQGVSITYTNKAESSDEYSKAEVTTGMKNALSTAKDYIAEMGISYSQVITMLELEGFTTDEATYAADNCGADWKEQAVASAKEYVEYTDTSKSMLKYMLKIDGYTDEQAEYAANIAMPD